MQLQDSMKCVPVSESMSLHKIDVAVSVNVACSEGGDAAYEDPDKLPWPILARARELYESTGYPACLLWIQQHWCVLQ